MRVLFATNIVLDVLLDRKPFSDFAVQLFSLNENRKIHGLLCATTITTIHYLASKAIGAQQAEKEISKLMALFEIAVVDSNVLEKAISSEVKDFEDAVITSAADCAEADAIITRNIKDFRKSEIMVYEPTEFMAAYYAG